jgi:hypothetical protein
MKQAVFNNRLKVHNTSIDSNRHEGHAGQLDLGVGQRVLTSQCRFGPLGFDDFFRVDTGKSRADGNAQSGQDAFGGMFVVFLINTGIEFSYCSKN